LTSPNPTNPAPPASTTPASTPAKASGAAPDGQDADDTPDPIHSFWPISRVVTIEAEAAHAAVARASIDAAGMGERVDIRVGRGADVLPTLVGGFDLVFIDADKESNTIYLDWAAKLGHPGTVVVVDNIGREGEIANDTTTDP